MNQAIIPATQTRPSGAADWPDIVFVLRRHVWLIVIGTIVCTGLAFGLWAVLYRYYPKYTAKEDFQVLSPQVPLGSGAAILPAAPNQEEITRFIRRQMIYILGDNVMDAALQTDAFQHDYRDPTSSRKSQWLTDNIVLAKKHLREDLEITPIPQSDVFTVAMPAKDPVESARLVNAVCRVYLDSLGHDASVNQTQNVEHIGKIVDDQKATVSRLQQQLADFRKAYNIDGIMSRQPIELQALGELNKRLSEVQGFASAAYQQLQGIKKQLETNTLQLSPEAEQRWIENDGDLRYLSQVKLQMMQEKAALLTQGVGPVANQVRALDARIAEVDRQTQERRKKQEDQGKVWMQDTANSLFNSYAGQMEYLKKERDDKEKQVKDLDGYMVQAQHLADELKTQQDLLGKLSEQYSLERLKGSPDDSRVKKLSGDAIAPEEISSPIWYKYYVPGGFVIGVALSFGLAYLFELTNTRVRTPYDITRTLQMPLLGFIPDQDDDSAVKGELSTTIRTAPTSMIAESFRQIRGRLIAEDQGKVVKTLLVASIAPGGGATTVASNIANGMALNEKKVLLVDANFYRPGLRNSYKNLPAVGLADVVGSPEQLDAAIVVSAESPYLSVMCTGATGTVNPSEMFESKAFRELLETLKGRYDMIVFDGAPLSLVSDSVALGARVDGVIAVVRAGEVSRGTVARVREQLRNVRAHFMGVVLNAAQTHGAGYFKENYRTFYKYAGQGSKTNGASVH